MKIDDIQKITVLGAGVMGHGIGQVAATSGYNVTIRDIAQEFLDEAQSSINKNLNRNVERNRMTPEERDSVLDRISMTVDLKEAISDSQLIIEATPEKMNIKKSVWREVNSLASNDTIFATNTSSLSITEIAEAVTNPERFVGMHFFNPPVYLKLVEVNPGEKTSSQTIDLVTKISEKMGKTPIVVKKDAPGFVVNRILITYLNEASKLLNEYDKQQIDAAMHYNAGMPLGPFMLMDLIGLDIVYPILKVFEVKIGPNYKPDEHIVKLYEKNKLGRKTGEGFYDYAERPTFTEEQAKGFNVDLLLEPFIKEAEKVVSEGIADEESVDTALKLGANLKKGPFELRDG